MKIGLLPTDVLEGWTSGLGRPSCRSRIAAEQRRIEAPGRDPSRNGLFFGCSHFLTGDMRLRERYTYTHERYGRQLRSPRGIHCVRPDLETIDALIVALS
jgi:hypothetical protein